MSKYSNIGNVFQKNDNINLECSNISLAKLKTTNSTLNSKNQEILNNDVNYVDNENNLDYILNKSISDSINKKKNQATQSAASLNSKKEMKLYPKYGFKVSQNYTIKEIIGKGSYGTVAAAIETSYGAQVAIKKVTNIFTRDILMKRAIRELKFMRYFKGHKNIVNLLDLEIVFDKGYDGLYCYQEMVDYDLARVIHSSVQFSEFHIQHFFYQIMCGLKYIHSADVIHRDLKPGNILCSIQGTLKICDFGLARGINEDLFEKIKSESGVQSHITSYVATRWYRAPELMLCRKKYSKAVDIWACGCILAEFYGRKPIFMGNDQMHQIVEILKVLGTPKTETIMKYGSSVAVEIFTLPKPQYGKMPWKTIYSFASDRGLDLIEKMLKWDSDLRLTCDEVLQHSFFHDIRNEKEENVCPYGPFDFEYEQHVTSMDDLTKLLFKEVEEFKKTKANVYI